MSFLEIQILVISALVFLVLSLFSPVSGWMKSAVRMPLVSTLIVCLFISVLLTAQNQSALSVDTIDESRFIRINLLIGLCALSWFIIALRTHKSHGCGMPVKMTFLFAVVAMLSFSYSPNPLLSLWKGFEVFATASVFAVISTRFKTLDEVSTCMHIAWLILFFLVITALVGGVLSPGAAFIRQRFGSGSQAYEFWGIFPRINPNSLTQFGAMVGIGGLIALLEARSSASRLSALFLLGLGLLTTILGHSRTSLLGFLAAAIAIFWFGRRRALGLLVAIGGAVLGVGTFAYIQEYVLRGQSRAVFMSMSGRTGVWAQVWDAFAISPLIGHGYYAGHRLLQINELTIVSSVDNTYLEVLVDLGIMGLMILLFSLVSATISLYRCRPDVIDRVDAGLWRSTWLLMLGALLMIAIRSLTGPTFQSLHPNLLVFLAIATCAASANNIIARVEVPKPYDMRSST